VVQIQVEMRVAAAFLENNNFPCALGGTHICSRSRIPVHIPVKARNKLSGKVPVTMLFVFQVFWNLMRSTTSDDWRWAKVSQLTKIS
jgi:hypothetical protein